MKIQGWKGANKGKAGGGAPTCAEPLWGGRGRRHFIHTCPVHHMDCSRLEVSWVGGSMEGKWSSMPGAKGS